jgi:hypothetical protein
MTLMLRFVCTAAAMTLLPHAVQAAAPDAPPAGFTQTRAVTLPAANLRGYGSLAGYFVQYAGANGAQGSVTTIRCDSEAKAKIVHAKYLSDLHLVGTVKDDKATVAGLSIPFVAVPDQGVVTAYRDTVRVVVVAASDVASLQALLVQRAATLKTAELTATGSVPMYLDSWDKHGFSFYYWPVQTPTPKPGERWMDWNKYNVLGEFDWAKKYGEPGLVFWQNSDHVDFAEGLTNNNLWEFGARAAANRGLPVIVNTSTSDTTWLLNRYPDDIQKKMPGYSGAFYTPGDAGHAGKGHFGWSAGAGLDAELSMMQQTIAEYSKKPTTIEYLEPHGELRHGDHDILNEYGPSADRSFRDYLKETYSTPAAVSQRWYGKPDAIRSWEAVRVPEVAHFLGFTDSSIDLGGEWRTKYEEFADGKAMPTNPTPAEWYLPATPDTDWPVVVAPTSDAQMFLPRRPAVWRRHFDLSAEWRASNPKVWLYVISLNRGNREPAPIYVNGKKVAEPILTGQIPPVVVDVSSALVTGDNVLALRLPRNFLGYKVYLTSTPPAEYPFLGEQLNAQWVDFTRWNASIHKSAIKRSFEAIRQIDPDRSVISMSPNAFISQIEEICQDYGGHFHDTGGMAGWWNEGGTLIARGADLPYSAEPGGPATNVAGFKFFLGNWLTEGVNSIHYFIHIGDVYWNDEIRTWYEQNQPIIGAFGKMHVPKAQVAMMYGDDVSNLNGWPWTGSPMGFVHYQFNVALRKQYHMDGVTPKDFARGNAAAYKVVVDTNTNVMDEKTVADIEAYVREGGVFVTIGDTGRHSPEKADSWPISRLTGYNVAQITHHPDWRVMSFAPGQTIVKPAGWDDGSLRGIGQILKPVAPDCVPLMLWPDGSTAVGMRKIGKGAIIDIGNASIKGPLLAQILAGFNVAAIEGATTGNVNSTHEVSNNGLYDVWITVNNDQKAATSDLVFRPGFKPAYCVDISTGEKIAPVTDGTVFKLANLAYGPGDIRILIAPRQQVASAPLDWLNLQRAWWRGTTPPSRKLAPYDARFALNLDEDWRSKPLDDTDTADHTPLAAVTLDDATWPTARFGSWLVPEDRASHRLLLRKRFTVPAKWNDGDIALWMKSWQGNAVRGQARIWLDGAELVPPTSQVTALNVTDKLKPGSQHLLAIEIWGGGQVAGANGDMFLSYIPKPAASVDLAGEWASSPDNLSWLAKVTVPGPLSKAAMIKRTFKLDRPAGQTAMFYMDAPGMVELIVNGHLMRRHHHRIGEITSLNVTPWLRFGADNEIQIPVGSADARVGVRKAELRLYPAGSYP